MSALYLKQLAEKTRRGLRGRVEQGRSGGGKSYGYDVVSDPNASDADQTGVRQVNEAEATVICRVFKLYRDGISPVK